LGTLYNIISPVNESVFAVRIKFDDFDLLLDLEKSLQNVVDPFNNFMLRLDDGIWLFLLVIVYEARCNIIKSLSILFNFC